MRARSAGSAGGTEVPAAHRVLARYADGSARSVQLQVDVDVSTTTSLTIAVGTTGVAGPTMDDVSTTLAGTGNNVHPKVWAVLPTDVLIGSKLTGPMVPAGRGRGHVARRVADICDYDAVGHRQVPGNAQASRDVWLYDRVTAMYRGYAIDRRASPLALGVSRGGRSIARA